jgi:hypothetical protein
MSPRLGCADCSHWDRSRNWSFAGTRPQSASRTDATTGSRRLADTYDANGGGTEGMSSNTVQPSGYATQGMPCAQRTAIVGLGRVGSAKQPPAKPVWPGLHAPNDLQ